MNPPSGGFIVCHVNLSLETKGDNLNLYVGFAPTAQGSYFSLGSVLGEVSR